MLLYIFFSKSFFGREKFLCYIKALHRMKEKSKRISMKNCVCNAPIQR